MSCNYAEGLSPYPDKGQVGMPERFAGKEEVSRKVSELAALMKASRHTVFHTGAGISTSAGIPDFRGPKGVWTLEKKGLRPEVNVSFDDARPTYTHMALVALEKAGLIHYLVTQNIDGLHLRSGFPRRKMAELHGNMYLDKCSVCKREFVRCTAVSTVGQKSLGVGCPGKRDTGRRCRGRLHDNILDWEHDLPHLDYNLAEKHSVGSDLSVCLGTTLQIIPSGVLPTLTKQSGGKLVICNLQPTKHDKISDIIINGYVDDVMRELLSLLNITCPEYSMEQDPVLITRALKTKLACSSDAELIEWTIPDSWFDDKDLIEKVSRNKAIAEQKNIGKKYTRATKIDRKKRKSPIKSEVKNERKDQSSSQNKSLSARNERYKKRSLDAGQPRTSNKKRRTTTCASSAPNLPLKSDRHSDDAQQSQKLHDSGSNMGGVCKLESPENKVTSTSDDLLSTSGESPAMSSVGSLENLAHSHKNDPSLISPKEEVCTSASGKEADVEMDVISDAVTEKDNKSIINEVVSKDVLPVEVKECDSEKSDPSGPSSLCEASSVEREKVEVNDVCSKRTIPSKTSSDISSSEVVADVGSEASISQEDSPSNTDATKVTNSQANLERASLSSTISSLTDPLEVGSSSVSASTVTTAECSSHVSDSCASEPQNGENFPVMKRTVTSIPTIPNEKLQANHAENDTEISNSSRVVEESDLGDRKVGVDEKSGMKSRIEIKSDFQSSGETTVESGTPEGEVSSTSKCESQPDTCSENSTLPDSRANEYNKDSTMELESLSNQKTLKACENTQDGTSNIDVSTSTPAQNERSSPNSNQANESQSTPLTHTNGSPLTTVTNAPADSVNELMHSGSKQSDPDATVSSSKSIQISQNHSDEQPLISASQATDSASPQTTSSHSE